MVRFEMEVTDGAATWHETVTIAGSGQGVAQAEAEAIFARFNADTRGAKPRSLVGPVRVIDDEQPKCRRCGGTGKVPSRCGDPECGDSTWDHECGLGGEDDCPSCIGATPAGGGGKADSPPPSGLTASREGGSPNDRPCLPCESGDHELCKRRPGCCCLFPIGAKETET